MKSSESPLSIASLEEPSAVGERAPVQRAEPRETRSALAASRTHFRTLFDFAPDGYLVTDPTGMIWDANLIATALFGVGRNFLVGKPITVFVAMADRPGLRALLNRLAAGDGSPQSLEALLVARGGRSFRAALRVAGSGELRWMVRDVSEQREAQQALEREVEERRRAEERLRGSEERYRQLSGHLQRRVEEERTRIAREVHDELGGALTAIRFQLSLAAKEADGEARSRADTTQAIARVDAAIQAMRRICSDLRPSLLDHLGLWAAIEWLAEDFAGRTGIRCKVDLDPRAEVRDPERATAVFRIVQEALTNALRHAHASEVRILGRGSSPADLRIEVIDNGRGIRDADLARLDAFGLIGMQERALACGGRVTFEHPGRGTRIVLRLAAPGTPLCAS